LHHCKLLPVSSTYLPYLAIHFRPCGRRPRVNVQCLGIASINIVVAGVVVSQSMRYIASWIYELRRSLRRLEKTNFGSKTQRDGFLDRPAARGFFKRRPSRALLHNPAPIAQRFELRSIPTRYRLTISLVHAASMPPLAGALGESPPRDHKRTSAPCSHSTSAIGWMHTLQTPIKCAETTSVCSSSSPVQAVVVRSVR
jgi:hypothetical protein